MQLLQNTVAPSATRLYIQLHAMLSHLDQHALILSIYGSRQFRPAVSSTYASPVLLGTGIMTSITKNKNMYQPPLTLTTPFFSISPQGQDRHDAMFGKSTLARRILSATSP